jgi:flagellar L-ring protein precursor FlgH
MMRNSFLPAAAVLVLAPSLWGGIFGTGSKTKARPKATEQSALDRYVSGASAQRAQEPGPLPGALWAPSTRLNDLARDLRASQIDDVVTILISETVNAAATGASTSERASSANSAITALAGQKAPAGALANLLGTTGDQKLNGTGTTSRAATLNATLTARVVSVLPGGLLLIEGTKDLQINSEQQLISVRGVIRPADITTQNTVASIQIADVEIRLNGKGVVGDAVRRPNALYRFVMGLLPF